MPGCSQADMGNATAQCSLASGVPPPRERLRPALAQCSNQWQLVRRSAGAAGADHHRVRGPRCGSPTRLRYDRGHALLLTESWALGSSDCMPMGHVADGILYLQSMCARRSRARLCLSCVTSVLTRASFPTPSGWNCAPVIMQTIWEALSLCINPGAACCEPKCAASGLPSQANHSCGGAPHIADVILATAVKAPDVRRAADNEYLPG